MDSWAQHASLCAPRRRVRGLALLVVAAGLAGCTNIGPMPSASTEPVGPFPDDYERIVRAWIDDAFFDVSSVEGFRVRRPTPGFSEPRRDARTTPF
jgi:hypothetical protein